MMKHLILPVLLGFLYSCKPAPDELRIEIDNPSNFERKDELIVVPRDSILKKLADMPKDKVLVVYGGQTIIPSQMDDLNADGTWDELAFVCDLPAQQKTNLTIRWVKKTNVSAYPVRTNIRFAYIIEPGKIYDEADSAERLRGFMTDSTKHYPQFEGPGWENDKIGFRNYFDERNGIDIFGKRTTEMVLDSVGIKEVYHELKPWGMDILKVGSSLGAGSLGIYTNDTIYRVSAIEGATFHIVTEGPVRSILDFDFKKVQAGTLTVSLKHKISIIAGEYGYRSDVSVSGESPGCMLVAGLVNLHANKLYQSDTLHAAIFYTHDNQTENKDTLGMGLILKKDKVVKAIKTPDKDAEVTQTYAIVAAFDHNHSVSFRFLAGWQLSDPAFANRNYFADYLTKEAVTFSEPVTYILN